MRDFFWKDEDNSRINSKKKANNRSPMIEKELKKFYKLGGIQENFEERYWEIFLERWKQ
jgi:hypothetical protein